MRVKGWLGFTWVKWWLRFIWGECWFGLSLLFFVADFHLVVCGLDSIVARRWINSMLVGGVSQQWDVSSYEAISLWAKMFHIYLSIYWFIFMCNYHNIVVRQGVGWLLRIQVDLWHVNFFLSTCYFSYCTHLCNVTLHQILTTRIGENELCTLFWTPTKNGSVLINDCGR